jgi:SAM-dependent methyltransferase
VTRVPDRVLLERTILPHFIERPDVRRVLLIGCDERTRNYPALFARQECWTLERLASRARFGARRHVRGDARELSRHFPPAHFDFILLNGLLGFGLDSPEDAEAAYAGCWKSLRRGGMLLVGWNRLPKCARVFPRRTGTLARFRRHDFAPLGGFRHALSYLTWHKSAGSPPLRARRWNHVFDFYRKP